MPLSLIFRFLCYMRLWMFLWQISQKRPRIFSMTRIKSESIYQKPLLSEPYCLSTLSYIRLDYYYLLIPISMYILIVTELHHFPVKLNVHCCFLLDNLCPFLDWKFIDIYLPCLWPCHIPLSIHTLCRTTKLHCYEPLLNKVLNP